MAYSPARRKIFIGLLKALAVLSLSPPWAAARALVPTNGKQKEVFMKLPAPAWEGQVSLEQAIQRRRTVRVFSPRALHANQLSQLLWAADGVTESGGYKRAAPSAGALYPMDIYAVVGQDAVPPIDAGLYHYQPGEHRLSPVTQGDLRAPVAKSCLSQMWMAHAPLTLVITAEYRRVNVKYGQRGIRYALMEAGHIGQNIFLQAQALGLAAGIVGAFHDEALIEALKIPPAHEPLLLMPVGYQK